MTSKTRGLMLGTGALALGVFGIAIRSWVSDPARAVEAPRAPAHAAAVVGSDRAAVPQRQWSPGTTYVYEIENTRSITLHGDGGPGQPKALGVSGRLSISVVGPAEDGILLRLAFDASQLAGAFQAVAEPTGKLASFRFPRGLDGPARAALKGLASALQVVASDPPADAWRTIEQDGSGEYEAAYRATGPAIHKVKERFVRARGPRGLAPIEDPSTYRVASSIDFELDGSGWPRTASDDETLTVAAGTMRVEARTTTRARLVAIEQTAELAALADAERPRLEPEPEVDAEGFAAAKRRADEGLVDGASYRALLADLASGDVKQRNRTMARLAALLRLRPEEAAQAGDAIRRGRLGDEATKRLIGSLGGAATEQAQRALASVLAAEDASPETRSDAAAALGTTRSPTDDSLRSLANAARSADPAVASTATLGLGNLIKHMNEQGSGDPSDALALLIRRLESARDDGERILCLDGLGNSGDARALPAIEPFLGDGNTDVRAAAVAALRFQASVDDQVVAALQDPAAPVRRAAAGALAYRAITPVLPLVTLVLQHDPDVDTRLELVTALRLRKRHEPRLVELLAWAAEHDPAVEVRNAARSATGSS